jgi:Uncharacterized protein conserved in bacteria
MSGRLPGFIARAAALGTLLLGAGALAGPVLEPARSLTPTPPAPAAAARAPAYRAAQRPVLALVIDDLGWDPRAGDRVVGLPAPITVAVLPGTPSSRRLADAAARRGHEIILHQPMEALNARWPGPGAMDSAQAPEELRRLLAQNLEEIPHRVGVSNHMGSRLTAQPRAMEVVMDELAPRDLYFLDSRTTPDTVAYRTARAHAIPSTRRDVFLDAVMRPEVIDRALTDALELAERRGHALAIGHPYAATLRILETRMAEIRSRVELVPVSRLIALRAALEKPSETVHVAAQ